jgi:hypothetical protein
MVDESTKVYSTSNPHYIILLNGTQIFRNFDMDNAMSLEHIFTLTIIMSFLILLIQRTERKARRLIIILTLVPSFFLFDFILRRNVEKEGVTALFLSLFLNSLFWVLVGRYNPVPNSDEMKVLGLDD